MTATNLKRERLPEEGLSVVSDCADPGVTRLKTFIIANL